MAKNRGSILRNIFDQEGTKQKELAKDVIKNKQSSIVIRLIEDLADNSIKICQNASKEDITPELSRNNNYKGLIKCLQILIGKREPLTKVKFKETGANDLFEWKVDNKTRIFTRKTNTIEEVFYIDLEHKYSDNKKKIKTRSDNC